MPELSDLSSTRWGAQHRNILLDAQGNPLKVNLQAVELEGRPKLVRTLKSAGALVVSNAKEAAVILVDSATESGKRLIRTWGHDANKVVLKHTWVQASIDIGRPLLGPDNWGGVMTIDDGKPITIDGIVVDEDELDEVEALVTNPLPTPRVTPVEIIAQRSGNALAEHSDAVRLAANASPHVTGLPAPEAPLEQSVTVSETVSENVKVDVNNIPQSPLPQTVTQTLPSPQPTLFTQPSQPHNSYTYAPYTAQQAYRSQSQALPAQPFPHAGLPAPQPQVAHVPSVSNALLPSVQTPATQMTLKSPSLNGVTLQTPSLAALMTMMEVMRHMDHSSWLGQGQSTVSQPPVNPSTARFAVQPPPAPTFSQHASGGPRSHMVDASLEYLSDTATSSQKQESVAGTSDDRSMSRKSRIKSADRLPGEPSTPSTSRKRPPAAGRTNFSPKRPRKGKERASGRSEVDELTEASDSNASHSAHSSASPSAQPRNIIAQKKHGEIFLSGTGEPLRFFVQVDLHGRHAVVINIKRNKGKIVNSIADADYLILFTRSDTFQGLLNEAIALGKSPILAAFVTDCVEEGALLDETEYILESSAKIKPLKRAHQSTVFIRHGVTRSSSSNSLTDNKSKKEPRGAPSKPIIEKEEDSITSRPPTPPPATTRKLMNNGKYLFTNVEDEYFLTLAKYHLTRDPTIPNTALVHELHKLMPHHTAASWAAHIDKKLRGSVDDIRKRANIAKRKHIHKAENENSSQRFLNQSIPGEGSPFGITKGNHIPSNPSHPSQEHLEQQDFNAITLFFASGGGDDDDDERVWQELERHQQCKSASSWPVYYAAHQKQVYARIEELVNEHAGD